MPFACGWTCRALPAWRASGPRLHAVQLTVVPARSKPSRPLLVPAADARAGDGAPPPGRLAAAAVVPGAGARRPASAPPIKSTRPAWSTPWSVCACSPLGIEPMNPSGAGSAFPADPRVRRLFIRRDAGQVGPSVSAGVCVGDSRRRGARAPSSARRRRRLARQRERVRRACPSDVRSSLAARLAVTVADIDGAWVERAGGRARSRRRGAGGQDVVTCMICADDSAKSSTGGRRRSTIVAVPPRAVVDTAVVGVERGLVVGVLVAEHFSRKPRAVRRPARRSEATEWPSSWRMWPSGVRYCSPSVARTCSPWAGSASSRSSVTARRCGRSAPGRRPHGIRYVKRGVGLGRCGSVDGRESTPSWASCFSARAGPTGTRRAYGSPHVRRRRLSHNSGKPSPGASGRQLERHVSRMRQPPTASRSPSSTLTVGPQRHRQLGAKRTHSSQSKNTSFPHVGEGSCSMRRQSAGAGAVERTWAFAAVPAAGAIGLRAAPSRSSAAPRRRRWPAPDRVVAGRGVPREPTAARCRRSPCGRGRARSTRRRRPAPRPWRCHGRGPGHAGHRLGPAASSPRTSGRRCATAVLIGASCDQPRVVQ